MPEAGPGQTDQHDAGPPRDADERPPTRWFFYGLGLSLQTLLWFLLFLAITVAVLVGGKLTEFRYVGF
jgi:hypothetical protein